MTKVNDIHDCRATVLGGGAQSARRIAAMKNLVLLSVLGLTGMILTGKLTDSPILLLMYI